MLDGVVAATERVRLALRAVGPELSPILIDVCCHLRGLAELERTANWPQRSAKLVLGLALSSLARHYGFAREDGGGARASARISHWGTSGFRPDVDTRDDEPES